MFRIFAFALLAISIASAPAQLPWQTNKIVKQIPEKKEPSGQKKPSPGPFHGKLAALDKAARTITVGKRTFHITSASRINKTGKPATLDDGVIGEPVSGYVKPAEDGRLIATTINFGPKIEAKGNKAAKKEK